MTQGKILAWNDLVHDTKENVEHICFLFLVILKIALFLLSKDRLAKKSMKFNGK